jgi:hypothetical protein
MEGLLLRTLCLEPEKTLLPGVFLLHYNSDPFAVLRLASFHIHPPLRILTQHQSALIRNLSRRAKMPRKKAPTKRPAPDGDAEAPPKKLKTGNADLKEPSEIPRSV